MGKCIILIIERPWIRFRSMGLMMYVFFLLFIIFNYYFSFLFFFFFFLLPLSPLTTNLNVKSLSRSSPTSVQPSNPSPTNVLFSKATRKAPLQLLPPSPVSHYPPRKMQMQSKRCFWWEIHPVSRGWNVMLIILERGVRGIRGGFWEFWEMEGLRGSGWRRRGMFVFL